MSELSNHIREMFTESDNKRDEGLDTPDDIERFDNILYGSDRKWQLLDVYRPKEKEKKKLPVIVSVHGGGWVYGNKERYQFYCMDLARRGFAVINFTYHLAPEYKYPKALEDTALVFQWVLSHHETYSLDILNIFAVGDSAGAHMLGLYAAACSNHAYASRCSFQIPKGLALRAIALNCGPYKIVMNDPQDITQRLIQEYLPGKGTETELENVSVVDHVTEAFPPVFLMTAIDDFAKPYATVMDEKLKQCGVPHVFKVYGDENNRLRHIFHSNIRL